MKLKPEYEPKKETQTDVLARINSRLGEKVKTVWRVEEWSSDEDDIGYRQPFLVDSSKWFETREEAEGYMSKVEVGWDNSLKLKSRTLYRKWVPGHWEEKWI